MGELLNDIKSISWWVSVVIVSLLVNLASAYLKPLLDKFASRYSKKRRNIISDKNKSEEELIDLLLKDKLEFVLLRISTVEVLLFTSFSIVITLLILSIVDVPDSMNLFILIGGTILLIFSILGINRLRFLSRMKKKYDKANPNQESTM